MSKLLANQIANYNDNGPVEVKEGVNVPSGKPFQVGGLAGTNGQYLKTTGTTIAWTDFPTIPAAQVSSDWNSSSGLSQILNKPTLATVATSGSYNDLSNKPTIPAAQVPSDWNATSGVERILNKPTLFSGSYTDLSNKPTIVSNLADLADVASTSPNNNEVLKWNGSNWAPATDVSGGGGVTTFTALTDTPGNFTSQGGKWLRVNAGATALEFIAAPSNTTYTQSSVADGSNVKLRLTDSQTVNDDILITAGNNITISSVTAGGFTIASTASGGATVTTDDSAPGSPSDGDLWWKSDEGRLKVYYQDANGSQWVDASPPLTAGGGATVTTSDTAPSSPDDGDLWWKSDEGRLKIYYADANSSQWVDASAPSSNSVANTTTNGTNSITTTTSTSGANANAIEIKTDNNTASAIRWRFTPPGHLIPFANAQYDIGSAEYKVRHMFLSDNTVYFEGDFLKVAQHNASGSAQAASYLIPLAKLKDALNASADYEAFKTAILAITDA